MPGGGQEQPSLARRSRPRRAAASRSSSPAAATSSHGVVAISSTDCISSGFTWPSSSVGHRGEDRLDLLGEVEIVGVEDHQLLLDADRERRPVEAVVEHGRPRLLSGSVPLYSRRKRLTPMEIKTATEQKSLLSDPRAGQAHPPAPPAVRVRPRPRHPAVPADRPGNRARPARLLPQPGLEGPRVPVPPRRRGRLLGDRLPDRPGDQVLPRLRGPGAADPEGQRQDRRPALRRRALDHQRLGRGRRPARRRRGRLHALRRLAAPGRRPAPAQGRARGLRPLRHAADHLGLSARRGDRQEGRPGVVLRDRLRAPGWRWRWAPTS